MRRNWRCEISTSMRVGFLNGRKNFRPEHFMQMHGTLREVSAPNEDFFNPAQKSKARTSTASILRKAIGSGFVLKSALISWTWR